MWMMAVVLATTPSVELPTEKMLSRTPVVSVESTQSIDQLQQCIGLALEPIGRPILTRVDGRRYVTFGSVAKSATLITLYEGTPVRVEARTSFVLNKKWRNRIRFCAS